MELHQIEAFVAVAEELHFGRAAERLRMAQSPLSQTIKKLERDVGGQLFDRNTRSVTLTAQGAALLPHARRALEELSLGKRAVQANTDIYGQVTIGFSGALNHLTLPKLSRELGRRHPEVELLLNGSLLTPEVIASLHRGTIDLGFIGLPAVLGSLEHRVISRERLGAVLPSDHPLVGSASIPLRELADEPFVTLPSTLGSVLRDHVTAACTSAGFQPTIAQEASDAHIVLSMVAAGVGVTLMPECVADILPPGTAYVPIVKPTHFFEAAIAWNPARMSVALDAALRIAEDTLPTPHTSSTTVPRKPKVIPAPA